MQEIARRLFASLNSDIDGYYVLIDGNFYTKFQAENETEAIKIFNNLEIKRRINRENI